MISAITNVLSNPTLANITQNTAASVSIETTLKSIGRPSFIMLDNNIDSRTKRYAATKEFLYQAICLGVYLLLIPPVFKSGSFLLGKKFLSKTHPEFLKFKNVSEYLEYHKFALKDKQDRLASLQKPRHSMKFKHHNLQNDLYEKETPDRYDIIKGTIEAGTFVGSVIGLALLAPQISHYTVHPIMKRLGFDK